jgi:hypothetical protein
MPFSPALYLLTVPSSFLYPSYGGSTQIPHDVKQQIRLLAEHVLLGGKRDNAIIKPEPLFLMNQPKT